MTKPLLLLVLIAFFPLAGHTNSRFYASNYPCETYEPNCDGNEGHENNGDWDGGEDERSEDSNGPDYDGSDDEI